MTKIRVIYAGTDKYCIVQVSTYYLLQSVLSQPATKGKLTCEQKEVIFSTEQSSLHSTFCGFLSNWKVS